MNSLHIDGWRMISKSKRANYSNPSRRAPREFKTKDRRWLVTYRYYHNQVALWTLKIHYDIYQYSWRIYLFVYLSWELGWCLLQWTNEIIIMVNFEVSNFLKPASTLWWSLFGSDACHILLMIMVSSIILIVGHNRTNRHTAL